MEIYRGTNHKDQSSSSQEADKVETQVAHRKVRLSVLEHFLNSDHRRCTPKLTIFFKDVFGFFKNLPKANETE